MTGIGIEIAKPDSADTSTSSGVRRPWPENYPGKGPSTSSDGSAKVCRLIGMQSKKGLFAQQLVQKSDD